MEVDETQETKEKDKDETGTMSDDNIDVEIVETSAGLPKLVKKTQSYVAKTKASLKPPSIDVLHNFQFEIKTTLHSSDEEELETEICMVMD